MSAAAAVKPTKSAGAPKAAPAKEVLAIRDAVTTHWRRSMIRGRCAPERHHIATEAGVNTGYWSWKDTHHRVVIGEEIREQRADGAGLDAYIAKFLRHELAHAKYTERDLKKLDAAGKAQKVPFRLMNLFEDARIEAKEVTLTEEAFGWLDHEPMPEASNASAAVFCLIQSEGGKLAEFEALPEADFRARAAHYYRRAIAAIDSWAIIPVAADFVKEFPEHAAHDVKDFRADMLASLIAATGGTVGEGMTVLVEAKGEDGKEKEADADAREDAERGKGYSSSVVMPPNVFRPLTPDQMAHAKQLADRLSKEFISRTGWTSTEAPSRRLNSRRLSLDTDAIYRNRTEMRSGKVTIRVIVDLSGSMGGAPSAMVRVVLTAMAILAQRGHASGTVTLSAGQGYETFGLAMSDKQIAHLEGYSGSEGLARTFRNTEALLADADLVLCLTDGCITDGPVDVARLARKGIRCLGLYLGDMENAANLSQWFASYLCRENMQDLVDEIGIRVRPIIRARAVRS